MAKSEGHVRPSVVGIGVSAESVGALHVLIAKIPANSGLAVVVVQHVEGTQRDLVGDELARHTSVKIQSIASGQVAIEPDHLYVVAPYQNADVFDGILVASNASTAATGQMPIDYFFRSLAQDVGERAYGVLLSGTGNDGLLGLQAMKQLGGLTFVQGANPARGEAQSPDVHPMRVVDLTGSPEQIAAMILDDHGTASPMYAPRTDRFRAIDEQDANAVLTYLKERTGHDFRGYKPNTIARRIQRRLTIQRIDSVAHYVQYLGTNPDEVDALFRELLIGVTSFFRDPEAFAALEQKVLAPLLAARTANDTPIRIWVPGCSTGEEAYSIAMLVHEYAHRIRKSVDFQIFATDIDHAALEKARAGRYPASVVADIDPHRLKKFFVFEKGGQIVQVGRVLRDSVAFTAQNVVKDPPVSKLDLICCRNLMIYFRASLQQRILPILHYALRPGGYLFLGNSETLGSPQPFFRTLDHTSKIYQRKELPSNLRPVLSLRNALAATTLPLGAPHTPDRTPTLREVTEQMLLAEHTPTAIVVDGRGDMHYVHGRTGRFLEQTTGEISTNILKTARDGLRVPLTTALHQVLAEEKPHHIENITIRHNPELVYARLSVTPIVNNAPTTGLMLVTLTEVPPPAYVRGGEDATPRLDKPPHRLVDVERELASTREYLHTVIQQLESTNEEVSSTNDELQSSNEELQSTNEELQTSKEELQSINEELMTLNTELSVKINELLAASNDIKNLLDNAQVGIIFLDAELRIRRFTASTSIVVDLIPADIGRPLAQFVHRLHYDKLLDDAQRALNTRQPKEMELRTTEGLWLLTRILPYRTLDDDVDGVVLTFNDITPLKESHEKLAFLFKALPVGITVVDRNRKSFIHNDAFLRMADLTDEEFANMQHMNRGYVRPNGTIRHYDEFAASRVLAGESAVLNVESGFKDRSGQMRWLNTSAIASTVPNWDVVVVTSDITAQKEAELAVQASEEKFSKAFHLAPLMIAIGNAETGQIIDCNQQFLELSGRTREEVIGKSANDVGVIPTEFRAKIRAQLEKNGLVRNEEIVFRARDGKERACLFTGFPINVGGQKQLVTMAHDISERKHAEDAIRAQLQQEKEIVLRELAHRTKNNMFVIRSMLKLRAMHSDSDEIQRLFADVDDRIFAMALVHQKLYQSQNLSRLDLGEYIRELVVALVESHSLKPGIIKVNVDTESISALIDTAIPCGLVVTELVSNAFKHAFPNSGTGSIDIQLVRTSATDRLHLEVRDDGIGVPPDFDFRARPTLGIETIYMIVAHQLKGTVTFGPNSPGVRCVVEFAPSLYSERV